MTVGTNRIIGLTLLAVLLPCLAGATADPPATSPAPATSRPLTEDIPGAQSNQPVDISSDSAHVDETSSVVVLRGNVIAKQGDVTLQADIVTVHYLSDAPGRPAESSSRDVASRGKIDRLDAHGNVVVTRPGEVVKGDAAIYKMIERQILVTGNVVATRDGNVVRGDSLTVDLVKSTIKLQANSQGRVRAVFTPPAKGTTP